MWAAAWGALALLKRHFGLAIEVGRQGQDQARQRRKSPREKWLFPTSHRHTLLLVTRREATLLFIRLQSIPGEPNARRPGAHSRVAADMLSQNETADAQKGRVVREVQRWAPRRGLALLVRVCMDSDVDCGLRAQQERPAVQVQNICPFHGYL